MIIIEDVLSAIVEKMGAFDLYDNRVNKPVFGWGVKDELNRFLDAEKNKAYPLIWLIPSVKTYGVGQVTQTSELVFAVNFTKDIEDWDNKTRMEATYKRILYPVIDKFLELVNREHNMSYDNTDYSIDDYPNYSLSNSGSDVIDLWDASILKIDAIYFNKC